MPKDKIERPPFYEWLKLLMKGDVDSLQNYNLNITDYSEEMSLANVLLQEVKIPDQHIDEVITCLIKETIKTSDSSNCEALKDTLEILEKKDLLKNFVFNEEEYDEEEFGMKFSEASDILDDLKKEIIGEVEAKEEKGDEGK